MVDAPSSYYKQTWRPSIQGILFIAVFTFAVAKGPTMRLGFSIGICALACLVLTSCGQYDAQQEADYVAQVKAKAANDDAKCRSYGVQPGSSGYDQCRADLANPDAAMPLQRRALMDPGRPIHRY